MITKNLAAHEAKISSQFGEDGVIATVAEDLGLDQGSFFEFGIGPADGVSYEKGLEGNFVQLRERGWKGVFLDGSDNIPPVAGVHHEFISALNINYIYSKYKIDKDLDFMSIDVDGQEFWIWMALNARPKVVIVEYNGGLPKERCVTMQFDLHHSWDGTAYHGASLAALNKLSKCNGYVLVWANGVNGMFLRSELVSNADDFQYDAIWRGGITHKVDPRNRLWVDV